MPIIFKASFPWIQMQLSPVVLSLWVRHSSLVSCTLVQPSKAGPFLGAQPPAFFKKIVSVMLISYFLFQRDILLFARMVLTFFLSLLSDPIFPTTSFPLTIFLPAVASFTKVCIFEEKSIFGTVALERTSSSCSLEPKNITQLLSCWVSAFLCFFNALSWSSAEACEVNARHFSFW